MSTFRQARMALVDAQGSAGASYSYDPFGLLMSNTESFANGWSNPYRYDGRDGVRYDRETGLYWMQVRAYDPALGRFLSRDPLGRAPLFFANQPYVYADNNPLVNVDPSGQMLAGLNDAQVQKSAARAGKVAARMHTQPLRWPGCKGIYAQCQAWASSKSAHERTLSLEFGLLQFAVAFGSAVFDLIALFQGRSDGIIKTIGRGLSLVANLLSAAESALNIANKFFGINTSGARQVLAVLAGALHLVASFYRLVENGLGWLFEGGLDKAWAFARTVIQGFSWGGLVLLVISMIIKVDWDAGKLVFRHLVMAAASAIDFQLAKSEGETLDQFCRDNRKECQGY